MFSDSRYRAESRGEFALNGYKGNHSTGTKITIRRKTFLSMYSASYTSGITGIHKLSSPEKDSVSQNKFLKEKFQNVFRFLTGLNSLSKSSGFPSDCCDEHFN